MKTELVVKEEVEINASKEKVWEVLTKAEYYRQWDYLPDEFKDDKLQKGSVIDLEGGSKLTTTRFEENEEIVMSLELPQVDLKPDEYDVTYSFSLSSRDDLTVLNIEIGDFSPLPGSQEYLLAGTQFAKLAKLKIKQLAEGLPS